MLFERDQSVISWHINNIFKENELDEKSNMHFLHIPIHIWIVKDAGQAYKIEIRKACVSTRMILRSVRWINTISYNFQTIISIFATNLSK
jgi:hypothetical protein